MTLKRYVAVDDCGPQINPVIVEGQVHGGVVQGIGQALWEEAVYDENGQLLTGSLIDYAIPRADVLLEIEVLSTVTPSPHHPLGVKGHRRGRHDRVDVRGLQRRHRRAGAVRRRSRIRMPLTPERVWRAMNGAEGSLTCIHQTSPITEPRPSPTRMRCSPTSRREAAGRRPQPDPAAQAASRRAAGAHRHRPRSPSSGASRGPATRSASAR